MKSKKLLAYLALEKRVGKICKTSPKKAEDLRCLMDRLWFAMSKTDHRWLDGRCEIKPKEWK